MSRPGPAGEVEVAGPDLPALVREWPEAARDAWEDKAAQLEYGASRMERNRAERAAEHIIRDEWSRRRSNAAPVR